MTPTTAAAESIADQASTEFLGRWNRLISTTNWEKGRIIHDWRSALIAAGADVEDYSDEAWAARVGQVSGQHVGRFVVFTNASARRMTTTPTCTGVTFKRQLNGTMPKCGSRAQYTIPGRSQR